MLTNIEFMVPPILDAKQYIVTYESYIHFHLNFSIFISCFWWREGEVITNMNFTKDQKHTYATFHGSGPRTLRNVRGFIVPAPTCAIQSKPQKINKCLTGNWLTYLNKKQIK